MAYVMQVCSLSKTPNLKQHLKTYSHSIARSAHNISCINTPDFKSQDALTSTSIGQRQNYLYVLPVA